MTPATTATFPVLSESFDSGVAGSLYLFDGETDWQSGGYSLFGGVKHDPLMIGSTFRDQVRNVLVDSRQRLASAGVDQCVATVSDSFVVIWTHFSSAGAPAYPWTELASLIADTEGMTDTRIVCRGEPPVVNIAGSAAFNFIFVRDRKYFLR